jgi:hypothetical protein
MRVIQATFAVLVCSTALAQTVANQVPLTALTQITQGPFGFRPGMSRSEVLNLVGDSAVKKIEGVSVPDDQLMLNTAPKPHPEFDVYGLLFSDKRGLVKLTALGHNIQTNDYGTQVHSEFLQIRDAVAKTYGEPKTYDFVESDSLWREPRDWMMSLVKTDRTLAASWLFTPSSNRIEAILLEAIAHSTDNGILRLTYQFEGFKEYAESREKKKGSVF